MLEEVWEKRTLLHCWWECKLVQFRTVLGFLKKPKIESTYDPTIPLLGIHLEKTKIWKERCTPIFTAALFTIVKTWMQPKCSSADEQIKMSYIYIYTMEHYSTTKKNEIMPFAATWMDLVSEVSQTKTNIWYHSHRQLVLKIIKMNLFAKQKQTSRF